MGGERATNTEANAPRTNTFYFDPSANDGWIAAGDLNEARNGGAATVLNNKIYLAGGSAGGAGAPPGSSNPAGNPPAGFDPNDSTHQPAPAISHHDNDKIIVEVFTLK